MPDCFKPAFALIAVALAATNVAAKASGPSDEPAQQSDEAPQSGSLLAYARGLRTEKGCAEATPAYRVVAAMGKGLEPAQHELGECLLMMTGKNAADTALLHEEGAFWLKRAAYAGNARAQRALVMAYAAPNSAIHNDGEALKWGLVYQHNSGAELYGFKELPPTLVPGLMSTLDPEEIELAETFANQFTAFSLPEFERPKPLKARRREGGGPQHARPPRQ
ncbi:MAG: hypothetical protein R3C40_12135 [Parvularculaceae bacterium]